MFEKKALVLCLFSSRLKERIYCDQPLPNKSHDPISDSPNFTISPKEAASHS